MVGAHSNATGYLRVERTAPALQVDADEVLHGVVLVAARDVGIKLRHKTVHLDSELATLLGHNVLYPAELLTTIVDLSQDLLGKHLRLPDAGDGNEGLVDLEVQVLRNGSAHLLGFEVPALRHSSRDDADIAVVAVCAEIVAQVVAVSGPLEERDSRKSPSAPGTQTSLSGHLRFLRKPSVHLQLPLQVDPVRWKKCRRLTLQREQGWR